MDRVFPAIYPDTKLTYERLDMLTAARLGPFRRLEDNRLAVEPTAPAVVR
jgi:hypothetical protein